MFTSIDALLQSSSPITTNTTATAQEPRDLHTSQGQALTVVQNIATPSYSKIPEINRKSEFETPNELSSGAPAFSNGIPYTPRTSSSSSSSSSSAAVTAAAAAAPILIERLPYPVFQTSNIPLLYDHIALTS
ncbi:unnamed protein product [Gongylonema pulchrum]|uniref:Uncharacterized protein n=1 Tax=Gongylonema pulchrum TaxID=637853 RepID=A0A183EMT0_9BILA|nr:unnamed protein product [Gongylonema pulchrum]